MWTHDTAVVIAGAARDGHAEVVEVLGEGLLEAAEAFGYRVPEHHGGDPRTGPGSAPAPVPYPASCRPQAWSAASSVALLAAVLGLRPDVPGGALVVHPAGATGTSVSGLRVGGLALDAAVGVGGVQLSGPAAEALRLRTSA